MVAEQAAKQAAFCCHETDPLFPTQLYGIYPQAGFTHWDFTTAQPGSFGHQRQLVAGDTALHWEG